MRQQLYLRDAGYAVDGASMIGATHFALMLRAQLYVDVTGTLQALAQWRGARGRPGSVKRVAMN